MADHLEKTTSGMVIVFVSLQMVGQIADSLAEDCDLHFRGSSVRAVQLITIYNVVFTFSVESHSFPLLRQTWQFNKKPASFSSLWVGGSVDSHKFIDRKMGVLLGRGEVFVAQEFLDAPQVRAIIEQVRRKTVAQ